MVGTMNWQLIALKRYSTGKHISLVLQV